MMQGFFLLIFTVRLSLQNEVFITNNVDMEKDGVIIWKILLFGILLN